MKVGWLHLSAFLIVAAFGSYGSVRAQLPVASPGRVNDVKSVDKTDSLEKLIAQLGDEKADVRLSAATALGKSRDRRAIGGKRADGGGACEQYPWKARIYPTRADSRLGG